MRTGRRLGLGVKQSAVVGLGMRQYPDAGEVDNKLVDS